ncbi:MAG: hypothetical protein JSV88_20530 [Candidatus Aminicenantes bacterium]|nr:MAG: hypothetical protein JSV88_20530 [Candidatus Aminicenantes bacterium]
MLNFKRFLSVICVLFLTVGFASTAYASHVVSLTIPLYGQENSIFGGPASAQMLMDGYPAPYPSIYYEQSVIWTSIQSHNSGEPGWATDPQGMQGALTELNPPPGTWALRTDEVKEDLMFQVLYWMNNNHFAVTTLINKGHHWVDIVGYQTDVEPVSGSDPVLELITIHDPWPIGTGHVDTMSGAVWYSTHWAEPVENPGTWENKYVAIIEPPQATGSVSIEPVLRMGTTFISPEQALQYAERWIVEMNLASIHPSYALLGDENRQALPPILVREEMTFGIPEYEVVPCFYIVPYCSNPPGSARVCVMVNAFNGDFEQVSSFEEPVTYVGANEVLDIAANAFGLVTQSEREQVKAIMAYTPCEITRCRAIPFWRIVYNDTVLYVDQYGVVYAFYQIISSLYGT